MKVINNLDLEQLITTRAQPSVSLYLPTEKTGREVQQNVIRLKNLLTEAENKLISADVENSKIEQLLQPASDLVEERVFWEHQSHGLAIFLWEGKAQIHRLPLAFEELAIISNRFHIKPLLPLLSGDGIFFVLGLGLDGVKLFQGSRYTLNPINVPDMPDSLAYSLRYDDPEKQLQHQTPSRTEGGDAAIYHAHGDDYDKKDNILQYFHQVDKAVSAVLAEKHAPMLLVGLDYLLPLYEEANQYPHLLEEGVDVNYETLSLEALHKNAWEVIEPSFKNEQQQAKERYFILKADGQVSTGLEEVVAAAYFGRVETLFVASGVQQWGTFDPQKNEVQITEDEQAGQDLLDFAAVHTLRKGGTVYALDAEKVPDEGCLAAVFRY